MKRHPLAAAADCATEKLAVDEQVNEIAVGDLLRRGGLTMNEGREYS